MVSVWKYDYENMCECSEDDNCGCSYPENMARGFTQTETSPIISIKECNLKVGNRAPNFVAPAVLPDNTLINDFNFFDYILDSYALLIFYRADFSAICPLEITSFNQTYSQLANRNIRVVAVSVDTLSAHIAWRHLSFNEGGIGSVQFPLISDVSKNVSAKYGVLRDDGMAQRATFFIDKNLTIRYQAVYDYKVERNINETLRVIDKIIAMDEAQCKGVHCWMQKKTEPFEIKESTQL